MHKYISRTTFLVKFLTFVFAFGTFQLWSQVDTVPKAPPRAEGEGPFEQLIIRGAIMIDGTGSPPIGPVDIVVENNRITKIKAVGSPGMPIKDDKRPSAIEGAKELDASGLYILPGFIDMHAHTGGKKQGTNAEYVFKLWMAHGVTSVREVACGNGLEWTSDQKQKSRKNLITAPRIFAYPWFGSNDEGERDIISTPAQAREWVKKVANEGFDGIKFGGARPDIMEAALIEAKKYGLETACHHAQLNVARLNVLNSAKMGLTSMEHWYGLPEALFVDRSIQNFRLDYNYQNEQHRFGEAGKLWKQAAPPFSDRWNKVMDELLELDFTLDPTFNIYEASRDLMRARRAEWHEDYTLPSLWEFYQPSKESHGSYWHNWGTEEEIAWKRNYKLWMAFVNEYKNRGGRVTAGSDSGFIFQLYGFGFIRELELLREAGFHPLEVIRAATLKGAEALGKANEIGSIEVGKYADMILIDQNPLQNLKVLYGTGAIKLTDDNQVVRVGGVKYTIKDGIIYDAPQLLKDVKAMVDKAKNEEGYKITQPGK
ncbi:MAG: amidohydrolase family protein [Bacteroidetes bacterium]|nr:amidohydrolase family protein [Bacteroidota bacterium]